MMPRWSRPAIREVAGQLLRFGMATGLSGIVSLGLPAILHELLHVDPKVAVGISQATVLLMNFITLRLFVFRGTGSELFIIRFNMMRRPEAL